MGLLAFPLVPALIGFFILRAATGGSRYCRHDTFRIALGLGLGTGIASCGYFCSLLIAINCIFIDAALLSAAAGLWCRFGWSLPCIFCAEESAGTPLQTQRLPRRLLPWALGVASASALILYLSLALQIPHGEWDAWSIYNMRARFLFRAGAAWRAGFQADLAWSHPDYPLLLPGSIARIWSYLGHESVTAQAAVALGFVTATAVLLVTAIWILRDKAQACAAGVLLVCTPFFVTLGAWQYADIPVAFYLLAAASLTCLEERFPDRGSSFAALAGLAAGMLAWTKNDGLMLAIVFIAVRAAAILFGPRKHVQTMRFLALSVGASVPLACVVYFKMSLAPTNDLFAGQSAAGVLARATSTIRYVDVGLAFANHVFSFAGIVVPPAIVLALYVFCFGVAKPAARALRLVRFSLIAAGVGYFFIYVLSPGDLDFRITGSIDRILIQLWPSILLASILSVRQRTGADEQQAKTRPG